MKNLNKTAKTIDTIFKVLDIFAKIAFVTTIVTLCILAVGLIFDLDPDSIGEGYGSVEIGTLELEFAEDAIPNKKLILLQAGVEMLISLLITGVMIHCIKCVRSILQPMADGTPFFHGVGKKLKTLARNCIILGIGVNVMKIICSELIAATFDVENILVSDAVIKVTIHPGMDATFLLAGAILLLLSYIFRYGEQLQKESDETL